jgi:hypothetical protein
VLASGRFDRVREATMKKCIVAAVLAAAAAFGAATTASATHIHSMEVRDGVCVLLAAEGGEKYVILPFADDLPEDRRHPLHVLVHLGEPGTNFNIGVYGTASDPCFAGGEYLND